MEIDETANSNSLWGEINDSVVTNTDSSITWSKDVLNSMENEVIINSTNQPFGFKNSFYVYNNQVSYEPQVKTNCVTNDSLIYFVNLLRHRNELKSIADKGNIRDEYVNLEATFNCLSNTEYLENNKSIFEVNQYSSFSSGIYNNLPIKITEKSALEILRSCICTILAFHGFSETSAQPLQILTEITEDYIKKMVTLLHVNVEKETLEGNTGFSDVLDRSCHEMGIGSIRNLTRWHKEMTNLCTKKSNECKREIKYYKEIIKNLKDQKCELGSTDFIPELHVTSMNSSVMSSQSFEAGLQVLQSLESQQFINRSESKIDEHSNYSIPDEDSAAPPLKRKRKNC